MQTKNKIGPNIEPCGTPILKCCVSDTESINSTY